MGERGDSGAAVDVRADVALLGERWNARVQADADPDRACGERRVSFAGGICRAGRGRESDEEGVALRVDLDASVGGKRLAQEPAVLGPRFAVALGPELVQ